MASVWLARERHAQADRDRLIALKIMRPDLTTESEFVSMFLDEVRLCRAVRHPNVIDVYDVGHDQGVMWMAMEWVDGDSLHAVYNEANKRQPIPLEIAVRIVADAAAGLHAAHGLRAEDGSLVNLVHRDVSPHNILIAIDGRIKLADFGIAKAIDRISEKTRTGHLKGKFGYMSPEQVLGTGVDRRSDVFSLGIVLYELTTGRRLFKGKHEVHTLELILNGDIPRPSTVHDGYPPLLEDIVMKALQRSADLRHPTAAALEGELREFLSTERILVPPSGVASLLSRVMGPTLEQRQKAVHKALQELARAEETLAAPVAPAPASERSLKGSEAPPFAEETGTSGISSLSQVGPAVKTWRPSSGGSQRLPALLLGLAAMVCTAYVVYQSRVRSADLSLPAVSADAAPAEPRPVDVGTPPPPPRTRDNGHIPLIKVEDLHVDQQGSDEPLAHPPATSATTPAPATSAVTAPAAVSTPPKRPLERSSALAPRPEPTPRPESAPAPLVSSAPSSAQPGAGPAAEPRPEPAPATLPAPLPDP
jgi:serine/threonine-protein kinase